MNNFLTVEEAAARLRVAPFTMRKYLREGRVRGVRIGRAWRIPEDALSFPILSATTLRPSLVASPDADPAEIEAALKAIAEKRQAK